MSRVEEKGATVINLVSVVFLGFFLGMRHATDPDHVVAVATIVSRERSIAGAMLIGAIWGIGHSLTILLIGGLIVVCNVAIPPRLGLSMEFSVAVMLVVLGVLNLTGLLRWINETFHASAEGVVHSHTHRHGDREHTHTHVHHPETPLDDQGGKIEGWVERTIVRLGPLATLRPLIVGVVHGLAGSAAVALLVLAAIPSPVWAVAYLSVFGIGTIVGMMLITAANAVPFTISARRFAHVNRYLGVASGLLSVGFGLFLAYRIGIVQGLFTDHPRWTPQ